MAQKKQKRKGIDSIKVSVYFYTRGGDFKLPQKHCFNAGWVQLPTNHKQGVRASNGKTAYFRKGQETVIGAINNALKSHGVKVIEEGKEKEFKKHLESEKSFFKESLE